MSNYNIAIVNSSSFGKLFPDHIERLKKIGPIERFDFSSTVDELELAKQLQGFNIIVAGVTPFYWKNFFAHKDELLLITRHGIGHDNIDKQAAKEHGTIVSIVPPLVERDAVAEYAVTNLLALMRKTVPAANAAQQDRWNDRAQFIGYNLSGKTVGVIGCGNIGSRVAEIFKNGFNMRLLVVDPNIDSNWANALGAEVVDLNTLLSQADVISLNASLNDSSYYLLNEQAFGKMKKGVYITNTARGDLIKEDAVLKALDQGIVYGLATDVLHEEPAPNTHPYFGHKNILVTPHISAYTMECLRGMGEKCVVDVERVTRGEKPDNSLT